MEEGRLMHSMLLDFYGELLTQKQRDCFDMHYNEDLSLSEIAEQTGFSSAAHLGGCFREYTGISPARFRREAGK